MDLAELTDALNGITPTASVAQLTDLVDRALAMETLSITTANQQNLPGSQTRQNLLTTLQAHKVDLAQQDPSALVGDPALATVKSDVERAAEDLNATVEGANYQLDVAMQMVNDMAVAANAIVQEVQQGVGAVAGAASTTLDTLKWIGIGAAVLGAAVAAYFLADAIAHVEKGGDG